MNQEHQAEGRPAQAVDRALRELAREESLAITVAGDCMAPALSDGERLLFRRQHLYWPGDVLVFRGHAARLTAHRLLGCYRRGKEWHYITRADSSRQPDSPVPASQVLGRVVARVVSPEHGTAPVRASIGIRIACLGGFTRLTVQRLCRRGQAR